MENPWKPISEMPEQRFKSPIWLWAPTDTVSVSSYAYPGGGWYTEILNSLPPTKDAFVHVGFTHWCYPPLPPHIEVKR